MATDKKLIIEMARILTIFRNTNPAPNAYTTAEEIVGKCLGDTKQHSLMIPPSLQEKVKDVFEQLDKGRGYRPPKRSAEATSIARMLKRGYSPEQITKTWQVLKLDKFYQGKELFMMTVESQIGAMVKSQKTTDPDKYIKGKYGHIVKR